MQTFPVAMASIVALTALAWMVRHATRWRICPVCVGVSATWMGLLAARAAGFAVEPAVLAMLLGASLVAVLQWLERNLLAEGGSLAWKALALPAGFAAVYALVAQLWLAALLAVAALAAVTAAFARRRAGRAPDAAVVADLAERMKKCC